MLVKKYIYVFGIAILLILLIKIVHIQGSININGQILFNLSNSGIHEITMYDCSREEFRSISADGLQAVWSENNTILLNRFDSICEYNLDTNEETIIYQGESFDFFAICNDNSISISKDNFIFLYEKESKDKKILVQDNGSQIHSWSDDGEILYYSDVNGNIKTVNTLSGEVVDYAIGYDPIVCETKLAYKNKDALIVKNLVTEDEYQYNGSAYSYCFSPDSDVLLVEDEIPIRIAVKNLFANDIVLGHSIIAWDYASHKRNTLIDSCVASPHLICDWK